MPPEKGYPRVLRTVGDHLKKTRLDRGLSQEDVARELGVSVATVTNWEIGKNMPQKYLRERIVGFLGYDPKEHGVVFPERVAPKKGKPSV